MMKQLVEADATESKEEIIPFYVHCLKTTWNWEMILFSSSFKQMDNVEIHNRKGTLHFIRFPTAEMASFLQLAKSKGSKFFFNWQFPLGDRAEKFQTHPCYYFHVHFSVAKLLTTVCATGGGAFKFEEEFKRVSFYFSTVNNNICKGSFPIVTR